jgi:Arc/MetJ-type ribon-helix-helix transcriptional regulator
MRKTSVYLDEAQVRTMKRLSEALGRSQAEIIREALRLYAETAVGPRRFAMAASGRGSGVSVADIPEEELLAGFGE